MPRISPQRCHGDIETSQRNIDHCNANRQSVCVVGGKLISPPFRTYGCWARPKRRPPRRWRGVLSPIETLPVLCNVTRRKNYGMDCRSQHISTLGKSAAPSKSFASWCHVPSTAQRHCLAPPRPRPLCNAQRKYNFPHHPDTTPV